MSGIQTIIKFLFCFFEITAAEAIALNLFPKPFLASIINLGKFLRLYISRSVFLDLFFVHSHGKPFFSNIFLIASILHFSIIFEFGIFFSKSKGVKLSKRNSDFLRLLFSFFEENLFTYIVFSFLLSQIQSQFFDIYIFSIIFNSKSLNEDLRLSECGICFMVSISISNFFIFSFCNLSYRSVSSHPYVRIYSL